MSICGCMCPGEPAGGVPTRLARCLLPGLFLDRLIGLPGSPRRKRRWELRGWEARGLQFGIQYATGTMRDGAAAASETRGGTRE